MLKTKIFRISKNVLVISLCTLFEGLIEVNGEKWQQRRIFVHGIFRGFGIGTAVFEMRILEECNYMIQALLCEGQSGAFYPIWIIMVSTAQVTSILQSVQ